MEIAQMLDGITGINRNSTISYCSNLNNVKGKQNIGGIVGINENATITECFNNSNVNCTDYAVGGIVGTNYSNAYITNCYNRGSSTGTGKDTSSHSQVGGIAGASTNTSTIRGCYNTANVTASYPYVGGIVGYNGNSSSGTQTVQNVFNTGIVKKSSANASANIGTSSNYAGYLIGRYGSLTGKYANTNQSTMSSWNNSTITSNLSNKFTNDIKDAEGKWKYNDGYPILSWQLEE